jgi:hypothetical protein
MSHLVSVVDYSGSPDPIAAIHAARLERQRRIAAAAFIAPPPAPKPVPPPVALPEVDQIALLLAKYRLVFDSQAAASIPTGKRIIKECALDASLTVNDLRSKGRVRQLARARQLAMWRIAKETSLSLPQIGRLLCRDHTTVLHAIRVVNAERGENVRGCGSKLKHGKRAA